MSVQGRTYCLKRQVPALGLEFPLLFPAFKAKALEYRLVECGKRQEAFNSHLCSI